MAEFLSFPNFDSLYICVVGVVTNSEASLQNYWLFFTRLIRICEERAEYVSRPTLLPRAFYVILDARI